MNRFCQKILVLLVLASLSQFLSGQTYVPLDLSEGATWSHTECGFKPDWGAVYKLKITGDTITNSHTYKKIYYQAKWSLGICANCNFTFNKDSATLFAFIRQDTSKKKVFFVYPDISDKEWLAYNFDITGVGQAVVGFSLIFSVNPESTAAGIYVYQLEVDSIDSICVNGVYCRRYYYGAGNGGNIYHLPEHWIEGIGSTHGLLVQGFGGPDWIQGLYCFHNKEGPVYYDTAAILDCVVASTLTCEEGMDCSIPTRIDPAKSTGSVNVYPNPATQWITVECNIPATRLELTFYDLTGKKIYSRIFDRPGEIFNVPLSHLLPGFYYLTIRSGYFHNVYKVIKR